MYVYFDIITIIIQALAADKHLSQIQIIIICMVERLQYGTE